MPSQPLERLRKRSEYLNVAKAGTRFVTPAFIIQFYQKSTDGPCRYGITASRKVGGAVKRNRAKRRLRALIQRILTESGHTGSDYVFIAREEILRRNFALMSQELISTLRKSHAQTSTRHSRESGNPGKH